MASTEKRMAQANKDGDHRCCRDCSYYGQCDMADWRCRPGENSEVMPMSGTDFAEALTRARKWCEQPEYDYGAESHDVEANTDAVEIALTEMAAAHAELEAKCDRLRALEIALSDAIHQLVSYMHEHGQEAWEFDTAVDSFRAELLADALQQAETEEGE